MEESKKGDKKKEMPDLEKMHEKELKRRSFGKVVGEGMPCVRFIDIYNRIFSGEEFKERVRSVIGPHTLEAVDVRAEFQRRYGKSPYIWIDKRAGSDRLHDNICFTEEGLKTGKSPILLN